MIAPTPVHTPPRALEWLHRSTRQLERARPLDRAADLMDRAAAPLSADQTGAALRGEWLGHALHPLLTDLPLGCWLGAGLLDVLGGRGSRKAAQRLVGLGLLAVPPTVAAGLVDARSIDGPRARRVAVVHAAGNSAVTWLYYKSWRARHKGKHLRGQAFGLAGGALAWYTGYLGGHLSFARGVGMGPRGVRRVDETGAPDSLLDIDDAAWLVDVAT